uniref:Integrase catalytic domain-containing protein n=1 Tax=Nicotiana tabacum TaxID=4097 RepID=A0A1S4A6P2_TOBAC|nr:PREDICTED: uncharacterized protein LOC107794346 [Nicotiana tabacum]
MSKVSANDLPTRRATPLIPIPMTIYEIRDGYHWPPTIGSRMPAKIVCDNGKQFAGSKMTKFFEDHKIKRILSIPYHPSGNGQAESTNKTVLQNQKKRLSEDKGKWREVLLEVLWAYRTTSKSSTGETPFSLVYSVEALIPVKVGEPSFMFRYAMEEANHEAMNMSVELLDKRREATRIRMAAEKQWFGRY